MSARDETVAPGSRGLPRRESLCPDCAQVQIVSSAKGSTFYLCTLARTDPRFAKYPPQPVLVCHGHRPRPPASTPASR